MTGQEGRPYDALVLAGGAARRLGGRDKPAVLVGGVTLLERTLAAVPDAGTVIVVGPERPVSRPVRFCREDPPGGGPAAALSAGLAHVRSPTVVLLAADLPFLDGATVRAVRAACGDRGAVLLDEQGRPQLLLSAWPAERLRAVTGGPLAGTALRRVLAPLDPYPVTVPGPPGRPAPWRDCDTAADLRDARQWFARGTPGQERTP